MKNNKLSFSNTIDIAVNAAILGGLAIMDIYGKPGFDRKIKDNNSPLTEAHSASNGIIQDYLIKTGIPIISEEDKNGEFTVNIALCNQGAPLL